TWISARDRSGESGRMATPPIASRQTKDQMRERWPDAIDDKRDEEQRSHQEQRAAAAERRLWCMRRFIQLGPIKLQEYEIIFHRAQVLVSGVLRACLGVGGGEPPQVRLQLDTASCERGEPVLPP